MRHCTLMTVAAFVGAIAILISGPLTVAQSPPAAAEVDRRWLERLPDEDRAAIEDHVGYAAPAFTENLKWLNGEAKTWASLRGKVVVLQSWTTATNARTWPTRLANGLKEFSADDVHLLALHTPENAENAEEFLNRAKPPERVDVVIDPSGEFCDSLGIYKTPVNFVIDRHGQVRYAGLNLNGLQRAVAQLVAEPFDPAKTPPPKPQLQPRTPVAQKQPEYPAVRGRITGANDMRGKRAPEFQVDSWYTDQPNAQDRVVVINFWSITDPPSLGVHNHLNELAVQFAPRVVIVGVTDDSKSRFEEELLKRRMRKSHFQYAVAFDRNRRMANVLNVTSIPHCIVMSRDWTVRWQGNPEGLSGEVLQQIIDADAASPGPAAPPPKSKRGWVQKE